jgi:hypothetical protein
MKQDIEELWNFLKFINATLCELEVLIEDENVLNIIYDSINSIHEELEVFYYFYSNQIEFKLEVNDYKRIHKKLNCMFNDLEEIYQFESIPNLNVFNKIIKLQSFVDQLSLIIKEKYIID